MKKLLFALALLALPSAAFAQCNGIFPNNTVCGNTTGSGNLPRPTSPTTFLGSAGGTNGQIQYNNNGVLGGFTASGDITINTSTGVATYTGTAVAGGRLTLASLVPVMGPTSCASAPCTNKSTVYYGCYVGCGIPIYNGTSVTSQQIPGEVSDALAAAGPGVVNANDVFDLWWAGSNLCHATNGSGGGWSADTGGSVTARGTGYTQLSRTVGFVVNANTITNCYNGTSNLGPIVASRATYLGSFYTSGAGMVSFTFGSGVSGGGAALFGLWNYYNRVTVTTNVSDISAPYTYMPIVYRQANNSAGNKVTFVLGVAEDNITATYTSNGITTATANAAIVTGLGFDSPTSIGCQLGLLFSQSANLASGTPTVSCAWTPGAGLRTVYALERGDGANLNTFNSSSSNNLSTLLRM